MKEISTSNFGLVIAYLLPGFVALIGVSFFSETVRIWLTVSPSDAPTVGGFLYVTLASLAAGLTVSTIRWTLIDFIHHRTGISEPDRDFSKLQDKLSAYQYLVETHYYFYNFYGGMVIAVAFTFVTFLLTADQRALWLIPPVLFIEISFWMGSRDTLRKYYSQGVMLLGEVTGAPNPAPESTAETDKRILNMKISMRRLQADRSTTCSSFSQTAGGTKKRRQ